MKCPKCEFKNPPDTNYCSKCGFPLTSLADTLDPETITLKTPIKELSKGITIAGKYKIVKEMGEGGMGTVFMADQTEPVKRRVALKIIKLGMDTKQVVARFEAERQAMALMNHPNIAKVYDAGTAETGRPYFVMELVRGEPITKYCDKHKLSTQERLELFIPVCNAIQHAHQKGLIHRDLKPSNILVEVKDKKPVAKIIDFGIAKATEHRLTERTLFTEMGQLIGTPEYMSPEQAEMTGLDVDTRTDVYSLGVILYELLVGALPFETEELRKAGLDEIRRKIREDEPPKPSTRVSTLGGDSTTAAKNRKTDVKTLSKQLRGELDWITIKALAKDRTQRYDSAAELAADIKRYLNNEPIVARPPSTLYLMKKLAIRNRYVLDVIGLILVLIVGFWLIYTERISKSFTFYKKTVEIQEKSLKEKSTTVTMLDQFMSDILNISALDEVKEAKDSSLEFFELGIKKLIDGYKSHPRIQRTVMYNFMWAYENQGYYDKAVPLRELSRKRSIRPAGKERAIQTSDLYRKALEHHVKGEYKEAEKCYRDVLEIYIEIHGDESPSVFETQKMLAWLLHTMGNYKESEQIFLSVLKNQRRLYGEADSRVYYTLESLGKLLHLQNDYEGSVNCFIEAVKSRNQYYAERYGRLGGWGAVNYIIQRYELFLERGGNLAGAEKIYLAAINIYKATLDDNHSRLAELRRLFGCLLIKLEKYKSAELYLTKSYSAFKEKYGADSNLLLNVTKDIVRLYEAWGKKDKAEKYRALLEKEK